LAIAGAAIAAVAIIAAFALTMHNSGRPQPGSNLNAAQAPDYTVRQISCDGVFNPPPDDTTGGEPIACGEFTNPPPIGEEQSPAANQAICDFIHSQDPSADPLVCHGGGTADLRVEGLSKILSGMETYGAPEPAIASIRTELNRLGVGSVGSVAATALQA
jgi:hypothetical protein